MQDLLSANAISANGRLGHDLLLCSLNIIGALYNQAQQLKKY
jgi:hypothetical protein